MKSGPRRPLASVQTVKVVVAAGARSTSLSEEAGMAAPNVGVVRAETAKAAMADFIVLVADVRDFDFKVVILKIEEWNAAGFRLEVDRES